MRINTGKANYEIVVRSHGQRIEDGNQILKKRIKVKIIIPADDGSVTEMLNKNERMDEYRRINGRPSCAGIQGEEKIRIQSGMQLLKFVQSRTEKLRRQSLPLSTIQIDFF